jgi:hypothetical protein
LPIHTYTEHGPSLMPDGLVLDLHGPLPFVGPNPPASAPAPSLVPDSRCSNQAVTRQASVSRLARRTPSEIFYPEEIGDIMA